MKASVTPRRVPGLGLIRQPARAQHRRDLRPRRAATPEKFSAETDAPSGPPSPMMFELMLCGAFASASGIAWLRHDRFRWTRHGSVQYCRLSPTSRGNSRCVSQSVHVVTPGPRPVGRQTGFVALRGLESPSHAACRARAPRSGAAGALISISGIWNMGSEPAAGLTEVSRRKPGLTVPEADQQHLVDEFLRMRLAETIGQPGSHSS